MRGPVAGGVALVLVAGWAAPAHAGDPAPAPTAAPAPAPGAPRRWGLLGGAMIAVRGNQGGVLDAGFRFVLTGALLTPAVDVFLSLDRQVGSDNLIEDAGGNQATWSEWVASARVGRRVRLGRDLQLVGAGGVSLVHAAVGDVGRSNLGIDTVAAIIWRSGPVVTSLVAGATAVPFERVIEGGGARIVLPTRFEPWAGLGVGLIY